MDERRNADITGDERVVGSHKLLLDGRKKGNLTGVTDVISFEPKEIVLRTTQGMLNIKGQDLKLTRLSVEKGEADLVGRVDSFSYSNGQNVEKKENGLLAKLFL